MGTTELVKGIRSAVVSALLAALTACASVPAYAPSSRPTERVVQLWCADLYPPLQPVAVHCWFAGFEPGSSEWRAWQVNSGGWVTRGFNHIEVDERSPDSSVTGQPGRLEHEWRGGDADRLWRSLEASRVSYPHRFNYAAWPGPNSNTYVAWVLKDAEIPFDMDPKAVGKDYVEPCLVGVGRTTGLGVQAETPLVGIKIGVLDGFELHFLEGTFGFALFPPSIKTPVGRFGPWATDLPEPRAKLEITVTVEEVPVSQAEGKR